MVDQEVYPHYDGYGKIFNESEQGVKIYKFIGTIKCLIS